MKRCWWSDRPRGLDIATKTPFGGPRTCSAAPRPISPWRPACTRPVQLVAVVGDDFPDGAHRPAAPRQGVDLGRPAARAGPTFLWGGRYHYDLNARDTLVTSWASSPTSTRSCRRATARPSTSSWPTSTRTSSWRCCEQVERPRLTALDSMNLWIETQARRADRGHVAGRHGAASTTARPASTPDTHNLLRRGAPRVDLGPRARGDQEGRARRDAGLGARACSSRRPPARGGHGPDRGGRLFAGGFFGYLASAATCRSNTIKRAMIHGSAVASFAVEDFSVGPAGRVPPEELEARSSSSAS